MAVVGSRAATSYGTHQATELNRELATMGHTVVSGLAYGVDQGAHRGAVVGGGPTIAVMPSGADRSPPAANAQLLEAIAERGLIVAEAPPGAAPTRTAFLARNRIVAGLSEGTVVVEGAIRSGALNTLAQWTDTLGRPVMGVPGPVSSAATRTESPGRRRQPRRTTFAYRPPQRPFSPPELAARDGARPCCPPRGL